MVEFTKRATARSVLDPPRDLDACLMASSGEVRAAVLGHVVRVDRSTQGNARVLVDNIVGYVAQKPVLPKPCATDVASTLSFPLDDSNKHLGDRTHVTALGGGRSWCLWSLVTASPIDLYGVTVQSPSETTRVSGHKGRAATR